MTRPTSSYRGYRFPPEIIGHAIWLYHRFGLSFRDVEAQKMTRPTTKESVIALLAGAITSLTTECCRVNKFSALFVPAKRGPLRASAVKRQREPSESTRTIREGLRQDLQGHVAVELGVSDAQGGSLVRRRGTRCPPPKR